MYRSPNRAIRGLPATLRYRRLGQFPSRYHPKWTGNDRFRSSVTDFGRYQKKREKIKKNVEFGATLPIQIHCPSEVYEGVKLLSHVFYLVMKVKGANYFFSCFLPNNEAVGSPEKSPGCDIALVHF
ncbi:hypothetical protein GW17_00057416 [Ensete ventricosum]|nr:hypothetical protein GW17_00057416 [Ensete ventricosum]